LTDMSIHSLMLSILKPIHFLFILDGFDELSLRNRKNFGEDPEDNLYKQMGLYLWKKSKMIITCRDTHLPPNPEKVFAPNENQFQQAFVASFEKEEVDDYLSKFLKHCSDKPKIQWSIERYQSEINNSPVLKDLTRVPIMLRLIAEVLPEIVEENKSKKEDIGVNLLLERFMNSFFERNYKQLREQPEKSLDLSKSDWIERFWNYAESLAEAMEKGKFQTIKEKKETFTYYEKRSNHEIRYWHEVFSDEKFPTNEHQYAFRALPLQRVWGQKDTFAFWHQNIQQFLHHHCLTRSDGQKI